MILSLKTQNILGFNYNMSLRSGNRESNKFRLKGHNLFSTYQITGDVGYDASAYKKIVAPFNILKVLNTPAFAVYCKSLKSVASIYIEFLRMDSNDHQYTESSYYIEMTNNGITKEVIDGTPTTRQLRTDPYKPYIPASFLDYFELQLFCYDLDDIICQQDLMKMFKESISLITFAKFTLNFLELCDTKTVVPINIYKDHTGDIKVKYPKKSVSEGEDNIKDFDEEDDNFKTMCMISWVIFAITLRTGVVVLHNMDKVLDYKSAYNVVEMFNHINSLDVNEAQLVFSAVGDDYELYPEQLMHVGQMNDITYCTWQNY